MRFRYSRLVGGVMLLFAIGCGNRSLVGGGSDAAGQDDAAVDAAVADGAADGSGADIEMTDSGVVDAGHPDTATEAGDAIGSEPDAASDGSETEEAVDGSSVDAGVDASDGSDINDAAVDLCVGVTCTASGPCHVAGTCDPGTGACSNPSASNGSACDDGDACTLSDSCQNGSCGGTAVVCTASDQCHVGGLCTPSTGLCTNPPASNGTSCTDGNACTQNDSCQNGACHGAAVLCAASDQCHVAGTCDPGTGVCTNPAASSGTSCNDGDACTSNDLCTAGMCSGSPYTCRPTPCQATSTCDGNGGCAIVDDGAGVSCTDDGNPCTSDVCDGSGSCTHLRLSDGSPCGSGFVCSAGACVADCYIGAILYSAGTINGGNACQLCTPSTSTTSWSSAAAGTTCDDGNPCTTSDACDGNGNCLGTACASGLLCANSVTAFTGTQTAGWNFNGEAYYDTNTNTAVLVDGTRTGGQAGTLIYNDPVTVDAVSISFDFTFTEINGRADGMAFILETNGNTSLGAGYGGFGAMGLTGYAVELDIYDSSPCEYPGETLGNTFNGNHAGIDQLMPCSINIGVPSPIVTSADLYDSSPTHGVGDIGDEATRTVTIQIVSGQVSVAITDATGTPIAIGNLQGVSLPGYVTGTPYYVGFSGGSGSNSVASRAEVKNVSLNFGANQCL